MPPPIPHEEEMGNGGKAHLVTTSEDDPPNLLPTVNSTSAAPAFAAVRCVPTTAACTVATAAAMICSQGSKSCAAVQMALRAT